MIIYAELGSDFFTYVFHSLLSTNGDPCEWEAVIAEGAQDGSSQGHETADSRKAARLGEV